MTLIIVLLIASIAIFIYKMLAEPSDKQMLKQIEAEENASRDIAEFKTTELIFNQFNMYIIDLFAEIEEISEEDLQQILSKDFPYYKNGDSYELCRDLNRADLIRVNNKTGLYDKGGAFKDLRLTFPNLIKFLKGKWNLTDMFNHDIYWKYSVEKGSISKIINSSINLTFFTFGVKNSLELSRELKISKDDNTNDFLCLYTKTETHIKHPGKLTEKRLLHYDFIKLEKELPTTEYDIFLQNWISTATELVNIK